MNDNLPNRGIDPIGAQETCQEAGQLAYCGNPLIEALPPINSEIQARSLPKYYPVVNPAIRAKPSHSNMHTIENAPYFYTPLPIHLALDRQLDRIIRSGYVNRNPMVPAQYSGTNRTIAEMRERHQKGDEQ